MKTLILLSIVFTMAFFEGAHGKQVVDQVCTGDVTLSSQAEVDAFVCTEVTGYLTISGGDITNLNTLSSLMKVRGNLSISDNPNLETIDLPALDTNDGTLSISGNGNLNSISGFNNLFQANSIHIGGHGGFQTVVKFIKK